MREDIKREAVAGIDDELIRAAYKPGKVFADGAAVPTEKRRFIGLKRAALAAAAVIVVVCGLLMMNQSVRAAVLGVFVWDTNNDGITISFAGSESDDESIDPISVNDVTVGYIPDGMKIVTDEPGGNPSGDGPEWRNITMSSGPRGPGLIPVVVDISITVRSSSSGPLIATIDDYKEDGVEWEEYWSHTTIRGMDAMVRDNYAYRTKSMEAEEGFRRAGEQEGGEPDGGIVYFGNSYILVQIYGHGLTLDELIKIAENVVW